LLAGKQCTRMASHLPMICLPGVFLQCVPAEAVTAEMSYRGPVMELAQWPSASARGIFMCGAQGRREPTEYFLAFHIARCCHRLQVVNTTITYFQCPIERETSCAGVATHREPCENGQGCVPGPLTWAALVLMGQAGDQGP